MAAHEAPLSWDSPGKNTGVGCHFLLQYMKVKSESEDAQLYPTLSDLFRNAGNNENSVTGKLSVRNLACMDTLEKEMKTHSSILAWRIPGQRSLVGCHLWDLTELDAIEAT